MTEIYYTKDHEWIKIDGNVGVVGITAYASEQLGDIVFVELPEDGKIAEIGKDIAVVESVKAASEVYSPVSGKIIESNGDLNLNPEIVNEDVLKTIKRNLIGKLLNYFFCIRNGQYYITEKLKEYQ